MKDFLNICYQHFKKITIIIKLTIIITAYISIAIEKIKINEIKLNFRECENLVTYGQTEHLWNCESVKKKNSQNKDKMNSK